MQVTEAVWSEVEQEIVQKAFVTAYKRETQALVNEICGKAGLLVEIEDVWKLHDFLSARRHDIDGKYDDSNSGLIFAFARLVKEKWLEMDDLEGLAVDKLKKVAALSRM